MHVTERIEHLLHVDRAAEAVSYCVPARAHRPDEDLTLEVRFFRKAREDGAYLWTAKNVAGEDHDLQGFDQMSANE